MIEQTWSVLLSTWLGMLLGSGLALIAMAAGLHIGRHRTLPIVRLVAWWLRRVIVPLLRSPSWWRRAGTVFTNNTCVLAAMLVVSVWYVAALAAIVGMGVSLGIALRCLGEGPDELTLAPLDPNAGIGWRLPTGLVLNLLEPPAIVVTLGLCLERHTIPLTPAQTWSTFALWAVPLLFLAACGEALWLGVVRSK